MIVITRSRLTKLVVFLAFLSLAQSQTVEGTPKQLVPPGNIYTPPVAYQLMDESASTFNKFVKVIHMMLLILCIIDLLYRYEARPLFLTNLLRFALFIYGSSAVFLLDGFDDYGGLSRKWVFKYWMRYYYEYTYNAYWGSGYLNCFNHRVTVDGKSYGFNYINILPIELLIFFLLKCARLSSKMEYKRKNRLVHFWVSAETIFTYFYGFEFIIWAILFFKQHAVLLQFAREGRNVDGKNDVVYWFSFLLAIWMCYEILFKSLGHLFLGSYNGLQNFPKLKPIKLIMRTPVDLDKKLEEKARAEKLESDERRKMQNDRSIGIRKSTISRLKEDKEIVAWDKDANTEINHHEHVLSEFYFMYQHFSKNSHIVLSQFYNFVWVVRWYVFAIFSLLWYKHSIIISILFVILDLIMIFYTIIIKKSFRKGWYFWLIFSEEVLVFCWHLSFLILASVDFSVSKMAPGGEWFFSQVIFWSYIFCLLIELALIFISMCHNQDYYLMVKHAKDIGDEKLEEVHILDYELKKAKEEAEANLRESERKNIYTKRSYAELDEIIRREALQRLSASKQVALEYNLPAKKNQLVLRKLLKDSEPITRPLPNYDSTINARQNYDPSPANSQIKYQTPLNYNQQQKTPAQQQQQQETNPKEGPPYVHTRISERTPVPEPSGQISPNSKMVQTYIDDGTMYSVFYESPAKNENNQKARQSVANNSFSMNASVISNLPVSVNENIESINMNNRPEVGAIPKQILIDERD